MLLLSHQGGKNARLGDYNEGDEASTNHRLPQVKQRGDEATL